MRRYLFLCFYEGVSQTYIRVGYSEVPGPVVQDTLFWLTGSCSFLRSSDTIHSRKSGMQFAYGGEIAGPKEGR